MRALGVLVVLVLLAAALPGAAQADDTRPPTIRSVSFDRTTYGPGQDVQATIRIDDESAVRYAFVSLRETSSSLVLFNAACSKPMGQLPATVSCSIPLPAKAPGGQYAVKQVTAEDEVGHSTTLLDDEATGIGPTITVDSPYTDKQPPVISDFQLDTHAASAGQTVHATFQASDESGLQSGGLVFNGPTPSTSLTADCEVAAPSLLACDLRIPLDQPAGTYTLSMVEAEDAIGYRTFLESRYGQTAQFEGTLQVGSSVTDAEPPLLRAIDMPDLPVPRGKAYHVHIEANDPSGIQSGVVRVRTVHGNAFIDTGACTAVADGLDCRGEVPARYPQGLVRLEFAWLTDAHHNALNAFAPWAPGCPSCSVLTENATMQMRFLVGPSLLPTTGADPVVSAVDPFFPDVAPGHILPVVVQALDDVANLTFAFRAVDGPTGQVLSVAGCAPEANLTAIGSLCHLIVPEGTPPGEYRLDSVSVRRGADAQAVDFDEARAPGFTVRDDADSPAFALPDAWRNESVNGVTLASFNSGAQLFAMPLLVSHLDAPDAGTAPTGLPPASIPGADGEVAAPAPEGPLVPAPHPAPALDAGCGVAALALALAAASRRTRL